MYIYIHIISSIAILWHFGSPLVSTVRSGLGLTIVNVVTQSVGEHDHQVSLVPVAALGDYFLKTPNQVKISTI